MSSAISVMRVAIQGEALLRSMPNNTAIMITFAACFALTLSAYASGSSNLASSVRGMIQETADVLDRVGNVTKHRNGLSSLYGRYLRVIAKKAASAAEAPPPGQALPTAPDGGVRGNNSLGVPQAQLSPSTLANMPRMDAVPTQPDFVGQQQAELWPGALHFSAMSDEQIVDFLNQPYNAFDQNDGNLTWEDLDNFEGVNWPNMPGYNFG